MINMGMRKLLKNIKNLFKKEVKDTETKVEAKTTKYGWEVKKCIDCPKEVVIHSTGDRCAKCTAKHRNKYVRKYDFNQRPVLAIYLNGDIIEESSNLTGLLDKLAREGYKLSSTVGRKSTKIDLNKKVFYWISKGIVIVWKEFYSEKLISSIATHRVNFKRGRPKYNLNRSEELKTKVAYCMNNFKLKSNKEIANDLGTSTAWVSHVRTGKTYSDITGIVYKRAYNI